jgi:hypothetical protein
MARHRAPRGLDLPGRQPATPDRLKAEIAKSDLGATRRNPFVAPFLNLTVLSSFRL